MASTVTRSPFSVFLFCKIELSKKIITFLVSQCADCNDGIDSDLLPQAEAAQQAQAVHQHRRHPRRPRGPLPEGHADPRPLRGGRGGERGMGERNYIIIIITVIITIIITIIIAIIITIIIAVFISNCRLPAGHTGPVPRGGRGIE